MNYCFLRKKPSPVPKIIVTPEYLAKGSLKKSYINTFKNIKSSRKAIENNDFPKQIQLAFT